MELKQEIVEKIMERLTTLMGEREYSELTKFEEIGMKSVNYSQLTTALEDEFDVEIPYMEFKRKTTIGEAADYVKQLVEE